jgi:unsaturated chondroitin disaccharide hydrolase
MDDPTEREALDAMVGRVEATLDALGTEAFPYYADPETGEWTTTADGNWCGGHWIGALWTAFERAGDERYAEAARALTDPMLDGLVERAMFFGMNCNYAGFRAHDVTDEERHREIGLRGADAMVDYYHSGARQIPLGTQPIESPAPEFRGPDDGGGPSGDCLGAVDALYVAVPVLWRAYRETGDPVYRDTAVSHADRHLDWYVRPDGSTWHHAEFDPETGALERQYNELAYSQDTCWARGQGWCVAGLAAAYRETGARRYLDALRRVTDYYREHSPPDLVPHWDFEHPDAPDVPRDTSAAGLAAYGLLDLPEEAATADLRATGEAILDSLLADYLTPVDGTGADDDRPPGMILEGCYNGPTGFADRNELIWTDYYVLRTLHRRVGDSGPESGS